MPDAEEPLGPLGAEPLAARGTALAPPPAAGSSRLFRLVSMALALLPGLGLAAGCAGRVAAVGSEAAARGRPMHSWAGWLAVAGERRFRTDEVG